MNLKDLSAAILQEIKARELTAGELKALYLARDIIDYFSDADPCQGRRCGGCPHFEICEMIAKNDAGVLVIIDDLTE